MSCLNLFIIYCGQLEEPYHCYIVMYTVSQKNTKQICFLSELRQISTDFDNFWQKDGKRSKYMQGALIFHLT